MNCIICKGSTIKGFINYPVDRISQFILIKEVPALICEQCGEYFLDDAVFKKIESIIESYQKTNIEFEILRFAA